MELELSLALPNYSGLSMKSNVKQTRSFTEAFEDGEMENEKRCLLLWSGQPNGEEDEKRAGNSADDEKMNAEENIIVGWPPINSLRKEFLHRYWAGNWIPNANHVPERNRRLGVGMYVKVKMEGVVIGRKIDLRRFNSHQALKQTLLNMFSKPLKIDRNVTEYTILYQDKGGEWMLAGDVPWETFMESVQRMEILRNNKTKDEGCVL